MNSMDFFQDSQMTVNMGASPESAMYDKDNDLTNSDYKPNESTMSRMILPRKKRATDYEPFDGKLNEIIHMPSQLDDCPYRSQAIDRSIIHLRKNPSISRKLQSQLELQKDEILQDTFGIEKTID